METDSKPLLLAILATNFILNMAIAPVGPLYPILAVEKGIVTSEIGLVFR